METKTTRLELQLPIETADEIDVWRRGRQTPPGRAEAAAQLIEVGLKAEGRADEAVSAAQLAMIEAFQTKENLPSRADAVLLLIDIALETVTGSGRRFWDKPIVKSDD